MVIKKDNFIEKVEFKNREKSKKISFILLCLFLLTQLIGLFIIDRGVVPELFSYDNANQSSFNIFFSMLISFVIIVTLFFFLIQFKWKFFLKIWFGLVVLLTLSIVINSFFYMNGLNGETYFYYSLLIALPFVLLKIFRQAIVTHNLIEIFIYTGLSIVFVNILSPVTIIILLVFISFYDMWAVWHSGIMQKMAKFQMKEMKIFNGFLIPYLTKEMREKINKAKQNKKKIKVRVPVALLGGGDVAFTMISAGVFLKAFGWIPALFIVAGALTGLTYLLFRLEKKKFYPAMPFITLGIFFGILISLVFGFL